MTKRESPAAEDTANGADHEAGSFRARYSRDGSAREALVLDPVAVARALGGEASGCSVSAPGPGHSAKDRSLSIKLVPGSPDGFLVYSHAGDPWQMCRDYVRDRLGLEPWKPRRVASPSLPNKQFHGLKLGWHWNTLGDWALLPSTRMVLGYLMHRVHRESGNAFPSQQTIADDLAISTAVVWRALEQARKRGWLKPTRHGVKRPNTYEMTEDPHLVAAIKARREQLADNRSEERHRRKLESDSSSAMKRDSSQEMKRDSSSAMNNSFRGIPLTGIQKSSMSGKVTSKDSSLTSHPRGAISWPYRVRRGRLRRGGGVLGVNDQKRHARRTWPSDLILESLGEQIALRLFERMA